MTNPSAVAPLSVAGVTIKQDAEGRFCLNDLHRAAGGNPAHRPNQFLRLQQTQELIAELENAHICAIKTNRGRNGGAFSVKEIAIAYANWISAPFYLRVIRTYDAYVNGNLERLPNFEAMVEAALTSPAVMQRLGGMFKGIFIKQANEAINERLPALVEAAALRATVNVMPGISAGEVWHDMLHLQPLRNGPQYLSRVLCGLECRIDGDGSAKAGRTPVILFDVAKVKKQIKHGHLDKFMREYVARRLGQGALFPIDASMLLKGNKK